MSLRTKNVPCWYPRKHVEQVDELVRQGRYLTRSEFFRSAVREKLDADLMVLEKEEL